MAADSLSADKARRELYRIMQRDAGFETKATQALELGEAYLDVDNSHIARIDTGADYWEVVASSGDADSAYAVGTAVDLERTFCQYTIDGEGSLTINDAAVEFEDTLAFETHNLHTYHGTTIEVNGALFGTVCFVAEAPREEPFADHETLFAELVARMVEYELSCVYYESELQRRADLLDVVNRVLRHNLRNDMNVVLGSIETLAEELGADYPELDRVAETAEELLALAATARRLDAIVRLDSAYEERRLRPLAEEVAAETRRAYPDADVTVAGETAPGVPLKRTFRTAVGELVENAAKHGGTEPEVRVRVENGEGEAEIHVVDSGPGLPEHEAAVLTNGKETPLVHGSGLGLWTVHWIVTDHGGSVSTTVTEAGTRVTITVPTVPFDRPWE